MEGSQDARHDRYNRHDRKRGGNHLGEQNTIRCSLCRVVSTIDSVNGLKQLRRRKRRKLNNGNETETGNTSGGLGMNHIYETNTNTTPTTTTTTTTTSTKNSQQPQQLQSYCQLHKEEPLILFCMEDLEFLCLTCSASHANHSVEALDVAQKKLKEQLQTLHKKLKERKIKYEKFVENCLLVPKKMENDMDKAIRTTQDAFSRLRKSIDEKEKEILESIRNSVSSKTQTVKSDQKRAEEKLSSIERISSFLEKQSNSNVSVVHMDEDDMQQLISNLSKMEELEEEARHLLISEEPQIVPRMHFVAPFPTIQIENVIKSSKYKPHHYHPHQKNDYYSTPTYQPQLLQEPPPLEIQNVEYDYSPYQSEEEDFY